jgi:hypothetical protein
MIHHNFHNSHRDSSKRGSKVFRIFGFTLMGLCFAALFALIFGFLVKWLWNWLMPAVFGLGVITYWQAFGIVLLSKLLFGSFGGHHKKDHDHFGSKFHLKRHTFFGDEGEEWSPETERKYHRYYRQYWREEGKKAFDDYIQRIESKEKSEKDGES